jgi:hypothetical protein
VDNNYLAKMTAYMMQSTNEPDSKLKPKSDRGYCILVSKKACKYGEVCHRECWSICPYTEGGYVYAKGNHQKTHWHIARNAKWTDGKVELPFKKL